MNAAWDEFDRPMPDADAKFVERVRGILHRAILAADEGDWQTVDDLLYKARVTVAGRRRSCAACDSGILCRAHQETPDLRCDDFEIGSAIPRCSGDGHYLCGRCRWRIQEDNNE